MMPVSRIALMLFAMGTVGCALAQQSSDIPPPPEEPPPGVSVMSIDSGFLLDDKQLAEFHEKAIQGDAEAAYKLSLHYMTIKLEEQSNYWSLIAAARGLQSAQYSRWMHQKDAKDCKSKLEALAWLRIAALNGSKYANEDLKENGDFAQDCLKIPESAL